jgi:uroporphyrinogen decarboxylase
MNESEPTARARTLTALAHREPDRVPADLLATPEVWDRLIDRLGTDASPDAPREFVDPAREAVLRSLEIDLRVLSYDMFCSPPDAVSGDAIDWWGSRDRSTPNRMWRRRNADGTTSDVWGAVRRTVSNELGAYDEFARWPLLRIERPSDLDGHPWPEPDWWDFGALPELVRQLDEAGERHLRYRIGSVFETAWQLRGMQELLMDLVIAPEIPRSIMNRITDVQVENTRRVLDLLGDRLDLLYFYDDVAAQTSLLISPDTWRAEIRPHHARLVELAHSRGVPIMYHCDGAIDPLIPELIDLGIDVLNPIQPSSAGMGSLRLKREFGDRLAFHGGIDIVETLPRGTPAAVAADVRRQVDILGDGGGYVLCSSHHLQPDTPVDNVIAMYDVTLRYRNEQVQGPTTSPND